MRRALLLYLLLAGLLLDVKAINKDLLVKLNKSKTVIGDPVTASITINQADSVKCDIATILPEAAVLLDEPPLALIKKDSRAITFQIIFTSAQPGELVLNAAPVLVFRGGKVDTLFSQSVIVNFTPAKIPASLNPIKPVNARHQSIWQYIAYAVLLVVAVTAATIAIAKRYNTPSIQVKHDRLWADTELAGLQNGKGDATGQAFIILKKYLQYAFGWEYTLTVNEMLSRLPQLQLQHDDKQLLHNILIESHLQMYSPNSVQEDDDLINDIRSFIKATKGVGAL